MTLTTTIPTSADGTRSDPPRRKRTIWWIALALVLLVGSMIVAVALRPAPSDRFRGADGIAVSHTGSEPMWWTDLVVSSATTVPTTVVMPTTEPESNLSPTETTTPPEQAQSTIAQPGPAQTVEVVAPGDALFAPDSHEIMPASATAVTEAIRQKVGTGVVTAGTVRCYTDSQGSNTYNDSLSQRRSDAILSALTDLGINIDLIDAKGDGESNTYDNSTETGRARNRRCEIRLTVQP